ncbi:MAG: hypothetical protein HUU19_10030 [Phycisphaerales bacterium]|nr:hypothetical protein [Phycisphaerales bacterium]
MLRTGAGASSRSGLSLTADGATNDSGAIPLGVELKKIGSIENATTKRASLFDLSSGGSATSTEGESRVPLIGEVPLVGEFFKSRNKVGGKTRFYVFIKATVLQSTDFEDLKYLSDRTSATMHVDDGFPGVKARVIR